MRTYNWLVVSILVVFLFTAGASAQVKSLPVDVPGTNVHFFLMRYTEDAPPYMQVDLVWDRLNQVFLNWVDQGQDPQALTPEMVTTGLSENNTAAVFLQGTLIVEVDEFHSTYNRATPAQLAEMWAANLRKGVESFVSINVLH